MRKIRAADEETRRAWTLAEFCKNYRLGINTAYEAIRDGRLIARKLGHRTIITIEDGERFIGTLPQLKLPKKRNNGAPEVAHQGLALPAAVTGTDGGHGKAGNAAR